MKKKIIKQITRQILGVTGAMLVLMGTVLPAKAGISGGTEPGPSGTEPGVSGTEIEAGVVVDYMGKLRFVVREGDTKEPIEGVSVELYVKGLDKYVLFGMTDKQGTFTMDVSYSSESSAKGRSVEQENGAKVELENNRILWKVYKTGYVKYPEMGEFLLDANEIPYELNINLYKEKLPEVPSEPGKETPQTPKVPTASGTNPVKTGDGGGSLLPWILGIGGAGVLIIFILRRRKGETDDQPKENSDHNHL